ncbi:MAG: PPC domain-containing protein [Bryobacteraceae bacterium]
MIRPMLLMLVAAATLAGAAPAIRDLSPHGAQRGSTFTLYLRGEGLLPGTEIQSTLPASFSRMTRSKDPLAESNTSMQPNSVLPFLVSLRKDAAPGLYPIRVTGPEGISNVLLFSVGDLPEVEEVEAENFKERNDTAGQAQKIGVPATVNGTLTAADVDSYLFTAKAGQKLVFEVEARRAGSAIDPAIQIFEASGKELARNNDARGLDVDCRLEVTFPKTGEYRVQVYDAKYSEQTPNFYRLKIGSYAYAAGLFPLGWRRGETVEVSLLGGNLPQPEKLQLSTDAKAEFLPVRLSSSPMLPLLFALSDRTEMLEPAAGGPVALREDVVVNGRIGKPAEVDRYTMPVEPGQNWIFEVTANSLGTSELDGVLTVYDAKGEKLGFADDGNGADPVLPFTVPEDVREIAVAVEDLLGRGGDLYGYRLLARKGRADFIVELATPFVNVPAGGTVPVVVNVQRRGYEGAVKLSIPNLPEGFVAAGGHVPPEAAAQRFNDNNKGRTRERSVITITAEPDVKQQALELTVIGEAQTPDGVMRREAIGPGMTVPVRGVKEKAFTAPWLGMQLPMATTSPLPVTLLAGSPLVRVSQGFEYALSYQVKRGAGAGAAGTVNQQVAGGVSNLRILKGENRKAADSGSFLVNTNFATPTTTFDMVLETQTQVDGKQVTITSPVVTFEVVPGYRVHLESAVAELVPGGTVEIAGTVHRELTFEGGEVQIRVEDLPENVACPEVRVPAGERQFKLACEAAAGAKPGEFEVRIASVAPDTGRKSKAEYKIPDVNAKLVVSGAKQAAR